MSNLIKIALMSSVMMYSNAQGIGVDPEEYAKKQEAARAKLRREESQKEIAAEEQKLLDGQTKTQDQKDLEAYYKKIGEPFPDGKTTGLAKDNSVDLTGGHSNDPYWNYETGMDDDPELVDRPWFYMFKTVRYSVYFALVAVPWIILGALLCATNVVINIGFMDGWAGGNVFLISQTCYLVLQYALSVILYLEVDPWLKYMKFIRIGSLIAAWYYLLVYIALSILLVVILDDLDGSEVSYMSMFTVMTLSYNLIFHTPVLLVNLMVILKEISMEFVQFVNIAAGTGMDDYSLAAGNLTDMFTDLFNWINPWWWNEAIDDPTMWDSMYE